jgi:NAD-dependent DNA ligase
MTVSEKIANIENTIKRHEYNFYVLGEKTISTPELEILKVELFNLKNMTVEEKPKTTSDAETGTVNFEFFDGI